jgi:hypothetical protein
LIGTVNSMRTLAAVLAGVGSVHMCLAVSPQKAVIDKASGEVVQDDHREEALETLERTSPRVSRGKL